MTESSASDDIAAVVASTAAASDASSASTPSEAVPAASATETPAPEATPSESAPAGPIPYDRHKAILERARDDARKQAESELRGKLGWAERYKPDEVEQAHRMFQWMQTDPKGFTAYIQGRVAGQQPPEPPQPDLRAEDGTPVYSAGQMQKLLDWQMKQWQQKVDQTYGPIRQQVQVQQLQQAAYSEAQKTIQQARENWPMFADLEPKIKQTMMDNPSLDLRDAYIRVYAADGRKMEQDKWRQEYEGTTQQKANAATTRPSRPGNVQPRNYSDMDIRELVEEEARRLAKVR